MRITVHIEQVVVDHDQSWSGGADTLAAATQAELGRLIEDTRMKVQTTAMPTVIEGPRVWITSANGQPIPRQLGVALLRVVDGVTR